MMRRKRMSKRASKRNFARTAKKVNRRNLRKTVRRGGYEL